MPQLIQDLNQLKALIAQRNIKKVLLFIGNGPRFQYKDVLKVDSEVDLCLSKLLRLDQDKEEVSSLTREPKQPWMAIFGGDTYLPDSPDLGAVMYSVKRKHANMVCLVSVQSWDEIDPHVDCVWKYPEERSAEGRSIYGGVDPESGRPLGATALYLGQEMASSLLDGIVDVEARGRVGTQEIKYAESNYPNIQVVNVSAEPKNYNLT